MGRIPDSFAIRGKLTVKTLQAGKVVRELGPFPNKVVSSSGYGRNIILRQMAGDTTYQLEIDSAAVGDDNTAAADGNTGLGNSLVSGLSITNMSVANNVLTVDIFVPDASLADDTYQEFGLFANGRLISRVIINPAYTKATGEDTLFTYELTLSG